MIPADVIRKVRLAGMALYGLALAVPLSGLVNGRELSGASIAFCVLAASGVAITLISHVRARMRGHRWETIRGYIYDVQMVIVHLTLGLLFILCAMFLAGRGRPSGQDLEVPLWYLPLISAIAVHQFVRAAHRITAKWRTIYDVAQGLEGSRETTQRFSAKYDMGFFVGISIVGSILSRYFGSNPVLLVVGVLGALSFPYALGSVIYQRVVLARLLPNDLSLDDWYALTSAPHTPYNTSAPASQRIRHTTPARRDTNSHL